MSSKEKKSQPVSAAKLTELLAAARKQADQAKKAAQLAKLQYKQAKKKFKEAKRTAKAAKKAVKKLTGEQGAATAKVKKAKVTLRPKPAARKPSVAVSAQSAVPPAAATAVTEA